MAEPPTPIDHGPDRVDNASPAPHGGRAGVEHHPHRPVGRGVDVHGATVPAMGGPLLVTPAGGTVVATDGMLAASDRLRALGDELGHALTAVDAATASSTLVPRGLRDARTAIRQARDSVDRLRDTLRLAAERYSATEQEAGRRFDRAAALLGALSGPMLRFAAPFLGVGGWVVAKSLTAEQKHGLSRFMMSHPGLITGPDFVKTVRGVTAGLDEATSTAAGLPPGLALLLGQTGLTGVRSSAGTIMAIGPAFGAFRETAVSVRRTSTARIDSAPVGAVQRLDRIPEGDQLRIERYEVPGQPTRWTVYVGPTETFSPAAGTEPWDLTSNVGGVAGLEVGAYRASELAMRDAGVSAGDPVQFVGFSQGGLVATMLAASGDWNAAGVQTFGAPAGQIPLPEGLQGMAVRNTDDFIPMLGGPQLDHHVLQVERQAFAPGQPMPSYHAAPAHQRDAYRATAMAIDAAQSPELRAQNAALDAFTGDYADRSGSTITVFGYHGERSSSG